MIDAVNPAMGLVPLASRPVKNVCSRTLVGPHSASYQLWYAVGIGWAGGGPLSPDPDDGLEASSSALSRGPLERSLDIGPGVSGEDGGDDLDCIEVDEGPCCCCSWSSLTFEWAEEGGCQDGFRNDAAT